MDVGLKYETAFETRRPCRARPGEVTYLPCGGGCAALVEPPDAAPTAAAPAVAAAAKMWRRSPKTAPSMPGGGSGGSGARARLQAEQHAAGRPSLPSEQQRSAKSRARRAAAAAAAATAAPAPAPRPWSRRTGPTMVAVLLTLLGSATLLSLRGSTAAGAPPPAANALAAASAAVRRGGLRRHDAVRPHAAPLPPATARPRFRRVVRMLVHALACGHAHPVSYTHLTLPTKA